jgi:hypothetical protein
MSGFDPNTGVPIPSQADEGVVTNRVGFGGVVLGLAHLAIGGVSVALAVDEGFADGKAAFGGEAWRWALGGVGAVLGLLAVRGLMRAAAGYRKTLTPEVRRGAARRGRVLIVVGLWFFTTTISAPLAEETVAFDSWVKTLFMFGGLYLTALGLALQIDPTGPLRHQRLEQGYGAAGTARILRVSETGMTAGDSPQVQVDFEIDSEGRTFEAGQRVVMDEAKRSLLLPGSTVNVLVDRGHPRVFQVDWNSWEAPASRDRS